MLTTTLLLAALAFPAAAAPDPMALSLLEPLSCAHSVQAIGKYEPDYDVKEVDCAIGWLKQARAFGQKGGKPTKYTNKVVAKANRDRALLKLEALRKWLAAYDSGLEDSSFDAQAAEDLKPSRSSSGPPTQGGSLDFKKP